MILGRGLRIGLAAGLAAVLAGCGGSSNPFSGSNNVAVEPVQQTQQRNTIWSLFEHDANPNVTVEVNKYIYFAAQDVLNFLPIETADPFTGVIVTGWGTPPGGGRAYKATIYVEDPALDARSLKLALLTKSGPASPETVRAVEDAILTRARQLRINESKL